MLSAGSWYRGYGSVVLPVSGWLVPQPGLTGESPEAKPGFFGLWGLAAYGRLSVREVLAQ